MPLLPWQLTETVKCPYDPNHLILPKRLLVHLRKCEKQHRHLNLEICPFDLTHRFKPEEMAEHMKKCPAYVDIPPLFEVPTETETSKDAEEEEDPTRENWENDQVEASYDPIAYCLNEGIPLNPMDLGLTTKAEKRRHWKEDPERVRKFKEEKAKREKEEAEKKKNDATLLKDVDKASSSSTATSRGAPRMPRRPASSYASVCGDGAASTIAPTEAAPSSHGGEGFGYGVSALEGRAKRILETRFSKMNLE